MKLFYDFENHPVSDALAVFTFGTFDGVHLGHQYIFSIVRDEAQKRGLKTACLTFSNHPIEVLRPDIHLEQLTSIEQKLKLLQKTGFDYLLFLPFDTALRGLSAHEFLQKVQKMVPFSLLVVGSDVTFGKDCEGNQDFIRQNPQGFEALLLERFCVDGIAVSSSRIRRAIREGGFREAEKLLGRPYVLSIQELKHYCFPPSGNYLVEVRASAKGEWKRARLAVSSVQQIALIDYDGVATELRFLEKE